MEKQTRMLLFTFLVVFLLAATVIGASAAYEVEDVTYQSLEEAVANVPSGGTIKVTADETFDGNCELTRNVSYTLESSGDTTHTLTFDTGSLIIRAGQVTLKNINITAGSASALIVSRTSVDAVAENSDTIVTIESGTTVTSTHSSARVALSVVAERYATLIINGGTFYGAVGGSGSNYGQGSYITINGGSFYLNPTLAADAASEAYLLYKNRGYTNIIVNDGNFYLSPNKITNSGIFYSNSATGSITFNGGTFNTYDAEYWFFVAKGACTVTGGIFNSTASNANLIFMNGAGVVTVSGGTFHCSGTDGNVICVNSAQATLTITNGSFTTQNNNRILTVTGGATVTVSGGTFVGSGTGASGSLVYARAGKLTFSGGAFHANNNIIFELALQKAAGDSFEISGGTYTLEEGSTGGVILRTTVGVSAEVNEGNYADPTKIFYLNDVDIELAGGTFIDHRATPSPLVDVSASNSLIVVGDAVFLSRYVKRCFFDVNDAIGADVMFAQNAVTVQYSGSDYYCYQVYEQGENTTYSPVMEADASVAITDDYDGIRFTSYIPASVVTALSGKQYTFGTLIAPADYVALAGGFTHDMLNSWANTLNVDIPYVDVEANNSIDVHADGSISFSGTLTQLNSYTRAYAAVSYVNVDSTYYYSTYDVAENAHTMADVAKKAYTAVVEEGYPSLYRPGAFSEYTTAEQERLRTYSGYTQESTGITVTPSTAVTFGSGSSTNLQNKATALIERLGDLGYTSVGTPIFVGSQGTLAATALERVEGYGYYIGVIDDTIVIAGSNNALAMQAIDVFEELCAAGGALQLTDVVVSDAQMIALNVETPFVYPHTRDMNVYNIYVREAIEARDYSTLSFNSSKNHLYNYEENDETLVDYPLFAAMEIANAMSGSAFNSIYVSDCLSAEKFAIHIGLTDTARELLSRTGKNVGYYGYFVKDGNVVITSYDDATLRLAKALFLEDLADYALDVNADGTADVYAYPSDYDFEKGYNDGFTGAFDTVSHATGTNNVATEVKKLITNVPRPAGLALSGAVNVSNGELELYYLGATAADYKNYQKRLFLSGYTVYMAEREVEGSYFVTYINHSNDIMLHVMYTAYAHASLQELGEDNTLDAMFVPTLRIISSKTTDSVPYVHHVLPAAFLTKQAYTKRTDSKLTVFQLDSAGGYLFTLEDGSFVVIDGGNGHTGEVTNFYNVLVDLHTEIYGTAPTAENPIRIAAWYLTHGHGDHTGLLSKFSKAYMGTSSSKVVVDAIIGNFPSNDEIYNAHSVSQGTLNLMGTSSWYKGTSNGYTTPVPFYNVHTGQTFFIGNLEFEVMFTTEDMHPWSMKVFNNGCTVIRLTVHAHDVANGNTVSAGAVAASKTSCMALGDIYARTGRVLRATFGNYLESDMMTVAHHGTGGEGELYEMINPQIILWPNKASSVRSKTENDLSDRYALENLEMIQNTRWRYILSSRAIEAAITSGGLYNPTIVFTQNGVAGLGAATTDAEVRNAAQAFVAALENPGSTSTISYGTGYYAKEDYSYADSTIEAFSGGSCVWWRGNYFSDVALPTRPAYPELPEDPTDPDGPCANAPHQWMDSATDTFGDEIVVVFPSSQPASDIDYSYDILGDEIVLEIQ